MEIINDYNGVQIMRVNTSDVNVFLEQAKKFDLTLPARADAKGRVKCIYVVDTVPPLSAVLNFVQYPFAQGVSWGAYAVILPKDTSLISKFIPIVTYGLNMTPLKNKYALKTFPNLHREDLTHVIDWLNEVVEKEDAQIDVGLD